MTETGFLDREVTGLKYSVYVPRGMKPSGLATILFLHGMGECGVDGLKQTAVGLPHAIRLDSSRWPFLVIMPQKPVAKSLWIDYRSQLDLMLKEVAGEFEPDHHRRYITGISQGGRGTYDLAMHLSWNFAAAAPVCGWTETDHVLRDFAHLPIWAFHGAKDTVVLPKSSLDAIAALKQSGAEAEFTLYPEADHNSWDEAYQKSELPTWFLRHSLGTP